MLCYVMLQSCVKLYHIFICASNMTCSDADVVDVDGAVVMLSHHQLMTTAAAVTSLRYVNSLVYTVWTSSTPHTTSTCVPMLLCL